MTFPKEHRAKIHSTDEIDKRFCRADRRYFDGRPGTE